MANIVAAREANLVAVESYGIKALHFQEVLSWTYRTSEANGYGSLKGAWPC